MKKSNDIHDVQAIDVHAHFGMFARGQNTLINHFRSSNADKRKILNENAAAILGLRVPAYQLHTEYSFSWPATSRKRTKGRF